MLYASVKKGFLEIQPLKVFFSYEEDKKLVRTSLHQDRFSNASVIYIEKDISGSIKIKNIK